MWLTLLFRWYGRLISGDDVDHAISLAVGPAFACAVRAWYGRPFDGANDDRVQCSVIVAARDEESRIEDTVRHLLAQRDVRLEVIVIDDRSTDRTDEILRRLTQHDDRVRTQRVHELPDGWLGKCHACHLGAASAKGDWILFTDADCWLKPDVISRALRVAEREGADHVTLTPGIDAKSLGAQAWHLAFLITLANWFSGVNRDRPKAYLGMGAFNLVRASAYRECGGYEALRLTVLDDVRLGLLLRRAGKRTRGFIGGSDAECHWGTTVRGMIQVMEKNYFAAMDFRLAAALAAGLGGMLFWCAAIVGPFTGTAVGVAAGLAMLTLSVPAVRLRAATWLGWYECTTDALGLSSTLLRDAELGVGDNSARRRLLAKYVLFARRVTYWSGSVTCSMESLQAPSAMS